MVAYSFKRRFCDAVANGQKCQTIRARRARHARPGERIQLYFGMRTKQCRKLINVDPVVTSVTDIVLFIPDGPGVAQFMTEPALPQDVTDAFARDDGFESAADFIDFWRKEHGPGEFVGVLIAWGKAA